MQHDADRAAAPYGCAPSSRAPARASHRAGIRRTASRSRACSSSTSHPPARPCARCGSAHTPRSRRSGCACGIPARGSPPAPDLLHKRGNIHRRRRSHIRKSQARKIFEMLLPLVRIQIPNRVIHCSLLHFQRYGILLLYMRRPVCQDVPRCPAAPETFFEQIFECSIDKVIPFV